MSHLCQVKGCFRWWSEEHYSKSGHFKTCDEHSEEMFRNFHDELTSGSRYRDTLINGEVVLYNDRFKDMYSRYYISGDAFLVVKNVGRMVVDVYKHICNDNYYLSCRYDHIPYKYTYKVILYDLFVAADMYLNKFPRDIIGMIKCYL